MMRAFRRVPLFCAVVIATMLMTAAGPLVVRANADIQAGDPLADILFVIDESGSMGEDQRDVLSNVDYIAERVDQFVDARFGLVGFGAATSHGTAGGRGHPHTPALTSPEGLRAALGGLDTSGGTEPGVEATVVALEALDGYRQGASSCVVLVTDEDADSPVPMEQARQGLAERNAVFLGIVSGGGNTASTYGQLASETGGMTQSIASFRADPTPVLQAIFDSCVDSAAVVPGSELFGDRDWAGRWGDPVNLATGNFFGSWTDLDFPEQVFGMDVVRSYNSLDPSAGPMGRGWVPPFAEGMAVLPSGDLVLLEPDGRRLRFEPRGDGTFTSPDAFDGAITATASGFVLTFHDGETWTYDEVGDVTTRSDWTGQTVTYERDDDGRVVGVSSSTGYGVTLTYDAEGRLSTAEALDGRRVAYRYVDDHLSEVVLADGGVQRWITDELGRVTEIMDPDDRMVLHNDYDEFGRVVRQTDPAGGESVLTYDGLTTTVEDLRTGETLHYVHDAGGRLERIVDPLGAVTQFRYDADGNLQQLIDRRGAVRSETFDDNGNVLTSTDDSGDVTVSAYDARSRLVTRTDAAGSTWTLSYESAERIPSTVTGPDGAVTTVDVVDGLIAAITDADSVTEQFSYDSARNLVETTDGADGTTALDYDAAGRLIEIALPSGATTSMTVDDVGRVTSETDAAGATTTHAFTPAGLLESVTDPAGAVTSYDYDDAGRRISMTDANGGVTSYAYDDASRLVAETHPGGATTTFAYGPLGRLETIVDPEGGVTTFGYDVDGAITTVTDPVGDTVTRTFDVEGRMTSETDGEGNTTAFSYDALDRLVETTHPDGTTETTAYDAYGRQLERVDQRGGVEARTYTAAGRLAAIIDASGAATRMSYDTAGRLSTVTDPTGGRTVYRYTQDGELASETSPTGLTTAYEYDPEGRVTAVTDPAGNTTTAEYTLRGELARLVDPDGGATAYTYDAVGRLTASVDPNGARTVYGHDARGNRTSRTDDAGNTERWEFDLADRVTAATDPLGNTTTATYDPAGRLAQIIDPTGRSETLAYDGRGLVVSRTFGDSSSVRYGYDELGRRTSMSDATGKTTYAYDAAGALIEVGTPDGDTIAYGYDLAGRRTSTTYPDGRTVTATFDGRGLQTGISDSVYGDAAFAFDADGRLVSEQLPDGTRRHHFDEEGRLTGFDQQVDGRTDDIALTWDPVGRLASQSNGDQRASYRYDPAGQLLEVAVAGGAGYGRGSGRADTFNTAEPLTVSAGAYGYDSVGNRIAAAEPTQGDRRYEFDEAGRLITETTDEGRVTYRYDAAGRRIEKSGPDGTVTYGYDARGLMTTIERAKRDGNVAVETRTLDGDGRLQSAELVDGSTTKATDYAWDLGQAVPQILSMDRAIEAAGHMSDRDDRVDLLYGASGRVGYVRASGEAGSFATDPLGSAIETASTTDLVAASVYTPYGTPVEAMGDTRGVTLAGQFGFRGELDTSAGLHLRARDYDTDSGQFLTVDPLDGVPGTPVETSPYHYANNDPVNLVDPLGLAPTNDCTLTAASWCSAAVATAAGLIGWLDFLTGPAQGVGGFASRAGRTLATSADPLARSRAAQILNQYRNSRFGTTVGRVGRSRAVGAATRALLVVGAGLAFADNLDEDQGVDRSVAETVGQVGFGWAAVKVSTGAGCAIGALAGGIGAPIGCGVGAVVGVGTAVVAGDYVGEATGWVWDRGKSFVGGVGDTIGGWFD